MPPAPAVSVPNKSTIVRSPLRALGLGLRTAAAVSPALAARLAERVFFTARRHPRPAWEQALLGGAAVQWLGYEGGAVPVWSWGAGPAVALVHGWEGRGSQLGAFVQPLVSAGHRVVAFDGPGHGDATPRRASVPDMAAALAIVGAAVGPLHGLIAHSMGAMAATLALSRGLAASRAVFVSPATDPSSYAKAFAGALGLSDEVRQGMVARIERRFSLRFDELTATALAPRLEQPLKVIHDELDAEVPLASGRALAAAWPGAELTVTMGLGHRRILRAPEVVSEAVAFVAMGAVESSADAA